MIPHPEAARSGRRCRPRYRSRSSHVKRRDGLLQVRGDCWWEAPGTPTGTQVRVSPREPGAGGATGTGGLPGDPRYRRMGPPREEARQRGTRYWAHGRAERDPLSRRGRGGSPLPVRGARGAPVPPVEPPPLSRRPRWSPRPRRCSAGECWAWSTPRTSTPSSWPRKTCESGVERPVGNPVPAPGASRDVCRAPCVSPVQVGSV